MHSVTYFALIFKPFETLGVCVGGGGGGGRYSDISHLHMALTIYFVLRFSVQNFEIQYFGGFQKNEYFWGYEQNCGYLGWGGSLHNWTNWGGSFLYILGFFS